MKSYEQKYKEALETAKKINSGEGVAAPKGWSTLEVIFPELKESEDERIRKSLIILLQHFCKGYRVPGLDFPVSYKDMLAWLEKQGEQKSQGKSAFEAAKEEKIDDANKVESKFKAGDWIISNDHSRLFRRIVAVDKFGYGYTTDCGYYDHNYYDNNFHLWTIQDAKEGDILCYEDEIFILKDIVTFSTVVYYCCYDGKHFILDSIYSLLQEEFNKIHPATTEQRHILFEKMEKAGYKWIASEKRFIKLPWCKS